MKNWPPTPPESDAFVSAFQHMKENIRMELHQKDMSSADRSLAQYMRTSNIGTRLIREVEGEYRDQFVALFETVTDRSIRKDRLRIFGVSTDEDGVYTVPTYVTHKAVNGVTKKEASVLADELIGGYYEQFEMANMMGVSANELRKISPERYEEQLQKIYDEIRQRALSVIGE